MYKSETMKKAFESAGARERYAMENGNKSAKIINGRLCYVFTYSKYDPFQDANGATFDVERGAWIN